jgi:hypothetical protein
VAGLVSIHHILWYALAIRQHSDFGITAAVGRKRPCNRRLVTALVPNRFIFEYCGGEWIWRRPPTIHAPRLRTYSHLFSPPPRIGLSPLGESLLGERPFRCCDSASTSAPCSVWPAFRSPRQAALQSRCPARSHETTCCGPLVLVTSNAPRAIQRNVGSFRAPSKN